MSLTRPGVWAPSAAWASTVWADGVWYEQAAAGAPSTAFAATLIPVVSPRRPQRPMDWSWLEHAYNEALVGSRQLGDEYGTQGEDIEDLTGFELDEELFGKRKKRKRRSE